MSKKNKSKKTGRKLSSQQLQKEIIKLFKRHPQKRLNPKQISRKLKVTNNRDSIQYALDQLTEEKQLAPLGDYKYKLGRQPQESSSSSDSDKNYYEGLVDMTRSGDAYIICEGRENDIHVSGKYLGTAMNGDRVRIRTWKPRGRRKLEGEVVKVLERARDHYIGTLLLYPNHAIVSVDTNPPIEVVVNLNELKGAQDNHRVVVRIDQWESAESKYPTGTITTVLGEAGSHDIEMKSILINNGFDLEFPDDVIRESEYLPARISTEEVARRLDLREVTTFTIDPDDAKDFDDALSIRDLDNGETEIGIHIADVAHYIKEGTPLDKEALKRSTSVYLVDRVLPMLPERLSNDLCSLRPNEDRLAFSAIFILDKGMKIISRWFGRTVIHSDRRFTYNEAQELLEGHSGDFANELRHLNKIAKHFRRQRFKSGAINFETDEVQFRLDEDGTPIDIFVKERKDAHLLVEDFMLLANREVATYISMKGRDEEIPFVYRIHDEPDPEKVEELARFAREMGFEMNISSPQEVARSYNRMAKAAEKDPGLKILSPIAIRTMAKAEYSPENIGHYGLGYDYYTHFTSPIRRYSDVLAHRILENNLGQGQFYRVNKIKLEEQCVHISKQERNAVTAERQSVKYKQVEYIEKHLGEEFTGYISGILDMGIFVELKDTRIEGMAPFENLDEPMEVADSRLRVKGAFSGEEYKIGQEVRVRIVRADLAKRQVEMDWIRREEVKEAVAAAGSGKGKGRRRGDKRGR